MRRKTLSVWYVSMVVGLTPYDAASQDTVRVHAEERCAACSLTLERLAVLGDTTAEAVGLIPDHVSAVKRTAAGRYVVTSYSGFLPIWFDGHGAYGGDVGRSGDGPGEYRHPLMVEVSRADTVYVYDLVANRVSLLTPTLDYVRSARLESGPIPASEFIPLHNGDLVFNGPVRTPDRIEYPTHLLDPNGTLRTSIGARGSPYNAAESSVFRRKVTDSADDSFWLAHVANYVLEHVNYRGQVLAVYRREADWFPSWRTMPAPTREQGPVAHVAGVMTDDATGLLWVFVNVAAENWTSGLSRRPSRGPHGEVTYSIIDEHRVFDTLVDVIDPEAGELIMSERMPGRWNLIVAQGVIGRVVETSSDALQIEIVRIGMTSR